MAKTLNEEFVAGLTNDECIAWLCDLQETASQHRSKHQTHTTPLDELIEALCVEISCRMGGCTRDDCWRKGEAR